MRVFVEPSDYFEDNDKPGYIVVRDPVDVRHLKQVRRIRAGERLLFSDGCRCGSGVVMSLDADGVKLEAEQVKHIQEDPDPVSLLLAMARPAAMESAIRHSTETGVDEIIVINGMRSGPWKMSASRLRRWEQIAREAAMQSERVKIPRISVINENLTDLTGTHTWAGAHISDGARPSADAHLLSGAHTSARSTLCDIMHKYRRLYLLHPGCKTGFSEGEPNITGGVMLAIGPEGGWTTQEYSFLVEFGFIPICISPNILRVETACVAAVSLMMLQKIQKGQVLGHCKEPFRSRRRCFT